MSTSLPTTLPTGPYVIRNTQNGCVIHVQHPDAQHQGPTSIQAHKQDEGQYKDQQIWWIEPLADHACGGAEDVVYSISTPGSGKVLEANPDTGWVYSNQNCGGSWQRWRLYKFSDPHTKEASYLLVNGLSGKTLDIHGDKPHPGAWATQQAISAHRGYNRWEFAVPVVGFPAGWFHMENAGSGRLLSQDYAHNAPRLLAPPTLPLLPSQHRRGWQFQWTLCHSKCFRANTAAERNSWYVVNRLTRAPLSPASAGMGASEFARREENLAWRLELDSWCNWRLTNHATSTVLQQVCETVSCADDKSPLDNRQSWILRSLGPSLRPPAPRRLNTTPDARPRVLACRSRSVRTVRTSSQILKLTMRLLRFRMRA